MSVSNDRMGLLAGLRTGGVRPNNDSNNQAQQLYMQQQLQQQQQQQQQAYMMAALQSGQMAPSQAQIFAMQQSQFELQLQQIQMANLALQEQILLQQQQQAMQMQDTSTNNTRGVRHQQSMDAVEDSQQARRGALRNLQQARTQRAVSSTTSSAEPSPVPNLDWQAQRLRYASPPPASGPTQSTPPSQQPETPASGGHTSMKDIQVNHRKSDSVQSTTASEAGSLYSPNQGPALILSDCGDEDSDEENMQDATNDPVSPTLSASIRAMSMTGAAVKLAAIDTQDTKQANNKQSDRATKVKGSKKHTVILSSCLPHQKSENGDVTDLRSASSSDETSSSGSISPTSERSEPASFDSANSVGTHATSLNSSRVSSDNHAMKDEETLTGADKPSRRVFTLPLKGSAALNPTAAAFAPATSTSPTLASFPSASTANSKYPSSLSLQSREVTSAMAYQPPGRVFSAPPPSSAISAGFTAPASSGVTILRQPKGVPSEGDLPTKNFSNMIRRKAVGALKIAAFNGGRISPMNSPVIDQFPQSITGFQTAGFQNHARNITSPPLGSATFATFGQEMAQRAMKRRSQQLVGPSGGGGNGEFNLGLGML